MENVYLVYLWNWLKKNVKVGFIKTSTHTFVYDVWKYLNHNFIISFYSEYTVKMWNKY